MNDFVDEKTGEIMLPETAERDASAAMVVARAELDMQVSTAKHYPRSVTRTIKAMQQLVTIDEESATECMYKLPRGGKAVVGPSIRFAEALKQSWGNCRAEAYISGRNTEEGWVEATGIFLDLETNSATKLSRRRRIRDKNGRLFNDDMIIMTENVICSIAMRECVLQGVPRMVWRSAFDIVLRTVRGDVTTLTERRDKAVKAFAAYGVKPEQLFQFLEVEGLDDITPDHLVGLIAAYQSIKNGEETVESMFSVNRRGRGGAAAIGHDTVSDALADAAPSEDETNARAAALAEANARESAEKAEPAKQEAPKRQRAPKADKPADEPAQAAQVAQQAESPAPATEQPEPEETPASAAQEPASEQDDPGPSVAFSPDELAAWRRKGERAAKFGSTVQPKELNEPHMAPALAAWKEGHAAETALAGK